MQGGGMEEQPAADVPQDLERKARKQVPGPVAAERQGAGPGEVNIWSGRKLGARPEGGGRGERRERQRSQYRCRPAVDTGRTRGSEGQVNTFCLFFAKGMCYQGPLCPYLHRLPTAADNAAQLRSTAQDIFGREKRPDGQDNRAGAGAYDREDSTTLYVNYGGAGGYALPQLRHLLVANFGAFGPVKGVHIVPAKTIAFVRFHWRASAEFAREAMDGQGLSGSTLNEVLSVRWASDDPNPTAVLGRKRAALDAVEQAALGAWDALPPEERRARLALAQAARARKLTDVADLMPHALLGGSGAAGAGGAGDSREQFDEWRGIPGAGEQAGQQQQQQQAQQQQQQHAGQQHVQQQQQQQQQQAWGGYSTSAQPGAAGGAWYKGWRQRHVPAQAAAPAAADEAAAPSVAAAEGGGEGEGGAAGGAAGGGLGLLAGYGSDSDSGGSGAETDADARAPHEPPAAPGQQRQQQQQQQQQQLGEHPGEPGAAERGAAAHGS